MRIRFLEDLQRNYEWYCEKSGLPFHHLNRLLGHCLQTQKEAYVVVDSLLRSVSYYFVNHEEYALKLIYKSLLHELIHAIGRWFPDEWDGLTYESPIDYVVELMLEDETEIWDINTFF